MVKKGLLVRLDARPGKENELEDFLYKGLPLALAELPTMHWFAFRIDESTYGIFDSFEDEAGRDAHLKGPIAQALLQKAPDLLRSNPHIENVDILAVK